MLNNITATQSLEAKEKFEQPDPVLVEKKRVEVVNSINSWKASPKEGGKHFEFLRSLSHPNMPDDTFYETLKKQLEEQGYKCLLDRKKSYLFEVSLPKTPKTPDSPAAEPHAPSAATKVVDAPATPLSDGYRLSPEIALAYCTLAHYNRNQDGPIPSAETASKQSAAPAAEAKIPAEPAAELAKPTVQSPFDVAALDKKVSTASSQMANMMKSIYRLLDKNHFKDKDADGKSDFLTEYTATCVYTLLSQGLNMMSPLLNELHAAGRLPMTAHLPPFAAFPNEEGRTCNNKRIVLTVCLSMANQNQTDADVLYLSLNTMYRLLDTVM